jgi:hypothetical protein
MSIYDLTNETAGHMKITHKRFDTAANEWRDTAVTLVAPGEPYTLELVPGKIAAEFEEHTP